MCGNMCSKAFFDNYQHYFVNSMSYEKDLCFESKLDINRNVFCTWKKKITVDISIIYYMNVEGT